MNKTKRYQMQLITALFALAFSLTSFGYITYAWFLLTRQVDTDFMEITAEEGIEYTFKYFGKNYEVAPGSIYYNTGYPNPATVPDPINRTSVTDYAADFLVITEEMVGPSSLSNPLLMENLFPDVHYTFAIEVTSKLSRSSNIELYIGQFTSPRSLDMIDNTTGLGITFSTAINIYSDVINTSGKTSQQITDWANSFVTNTTPTDRFTVVNQASSTTPIELTGGGIAPSTSETTESLIFLFTIAFSNNGESYYKFVSSTNGTTYYILDPTGNSNVYQNLEFYINRLEIHVAN